MYFCSYFTTIQTFAITGISSYLVYIVYLLISDRLSEERNRLKKVLKRKHGERREEFTRLRSIYKMGPEERRIMALSWDDLVEGLQTRTLTATKVVEAHIAKALEISEKCNPVTDFIPLAHAWAKELDELKEVKGPLHGVPFCLKEELDVVGMDSTLGFAKRLYKPATESAVIVKVLQDLGAVPFCKTNLPQTIVSYGGDNPIYGNTLNGRNNKLAPGGSSSGTASLIAAGGAHFGTGSDAGGSLRIPAHFNGISSLKPTPGRYSLKGAATPIEVLIGASPTLGIMASTPVILTFVMQKMLEHGHQLKYDHLVLPIPWNTPILESKKKLRIGYFTSLPFFPTIGDSGDMVLKAKSSLETLGHTLVPYEMPDLYSLMGISGNAMMAGCLKQLQKSWEFEPIADSVKPLLFASYMPSWVMRMIRMTFKSKVIPSLHSKRMAASFDQGIKSVNDYYEATGKINGILEKIVTEWKKLKLDCLISNVHHVPAPPLDAPLICASVYVLIWNLLAFPAGVIPMGIESGKKIDQFDDEGDWALKRAKEGVKGSIGAPIGVQVIGLPYQDEMTLRIMNELWLANPNPII